MPIPVLKVNPIFLFSIKICKNYLIKNPKIVDLGQWKFKFQAKMESKVCETEAESLVIKHKAFRVNATKGYG